MRVFNPLIKQLNFLTKNHHIKVQQDILGELKIIEKILKEEKSMQDEEELRKLKL